MRANVKNIEKLHSLKKKLNDGGCLFDWEEKVIFAAWDNKVEDELREFKEKFKFRVQYEIR